MTMPEFQRQTGPVGEKSGANFMDRNQIKKLAAEGADAGFIAAKLGIKLTVIQAFLPKGTGEIDRPADDLSDMLDEPKAKPKPRKKPVAKKAG